MRSLLPFCLLVIVASCSKDQNGIGGKRLESVTVNGKLYERFSYDAQARLQKSDLFGHCMLSPMDEEEFIYDGDRLVKTIATSRSLYSSSTASCDPAGGLRTEKTYTYNSAGKIDKVKLPNSSVQFFYNNAGLVERQVIDNNPAYTNRYEYDARGNLVKVIDNQGSVTTYEYDDKKNPYYLIKVHPSIITAFNVSPNNVVRGLGSGAVFFTRQFTYHSDGLPATVTESNIPSTYTFNYR